MNRIQNIAKVICSFGLVGALVIGQFPVTAYAGSDIIFFSESGHDKSTITKFENLDESVSHQKLYVGSSFSDIIFPSSIKATVYEKEESASKDSTIEKSSQDSSRKENEAEQDEEIIFFSSEEASKEALNESASKGESKEVENKSASKGESKEIENESASKAESKTEGLSISENTKTEKDSTNSETPAQSDNASSGSAAESTAMPNSSVSQTSEKEATTDNSSKTASDSSLDSQSQSSAASSSASTAMNEKSSSAASSASSSTESDEESEGNLESSDGAGSTSASDLQGFAGSIRDLVVSSFTPLIVSAAENSKKDNTLGSIKEQTIDEVKWILDSSKSSSPVFSSEKAGEYFVYTPEIPDSYAVEKEAELPTITVTIVEKEIKMPACELTQSIDGVRIMISADEGVFPEGVTLKVQKVSSYKEKLAEEAVESERESHKNVAVSYTWDIKVIDKEGKEVQPKDESKVKVSFKLEEVADKNLETNVYHITEKDGPQGGLSGLEAEKLQVETHGDTAVAETDGFSMYTVEFTYDELRYVMNGGGEVPLSEILNTVGLTGEVTGVSVSDSSLFSASRNGSVWIITSHQPFNTEEWMKVTISDVEFEIIVTDDTPVSAWTNLQTSFTNGGEVLLTGAVTAGTSDTHLTVPSGKTATLNLNGYNIDLGNKDDCVILVQGNLTITGTGTIKGASSTGNVGGGICIDNGGVLTMNGGTISANTADNGAGVYIKSGGSFNMNAGSITGNTATSNGGGIYVESGAGTLTVTGSASVTNNRKGNDENNIYLESGTASNQFVISGDLSGSNGIGITRAAGTGTFAIAGGSYQISESDKDKIKSDNSNHFVKLDSNQLVLSDLTSSWVALQNALNLGQEVKLGSDISPSASDATYLYVPNAKTVTIDLNGHKINSQITQAKNNGYVIKVEGNLTVKDTASGGSITGGNNTGNGGGVYVASGSFTLLSGNITGNTAANGGGVYLGSGTFTLKGGSIASNTASGNGGGVFFAGGTMNVSGAPSVKNNTKGGATSNIYLDSTNTMSITGTLNGGADSIGVSKLGVTGTIAQGTASYTLVDGDATPVFCDDSNYHAKRVSVGTGKLDLERIVYTVKYNGNGSTGGTMADQQFNSGEAGNLTHVAFTRELTASFNYNGATSGNDTISATAVSDFDGWATSTTGAKAYNDQQSVTFKPDNTSGTNVDLYAKWTDSYVDLPNPVKDGYSFDGWYTDSAFGDGTRIGSGGDTYRPDASVQLYAKWIRILNNPTIELSQTSFTYDKTAKTPIVACVKDGSTVVDETEYGVSYNNNIDAGTATVIITDNPGGNYNVSGSTTFTINKKTVTVNGITANGKTYDGTTDATLVTSGASFAGLISGDSLTVSATGTFADAGAGNGKTVNISGLTLGGASLSNYVLAQSGNQTTTTANISKRAISVKAKNQNVSVGGSISTGADYVDISSGTLASGHSIGSVALSASSTSAITTSGTIKPSAAVIKNSSGSGVTSNYDITYQNGVLRVGKSVAKVTTIPTAASLTYSGVAQNLLASKGLADTSMEFSRDGTNYSSTIPKETGAGEYKVYYRAAGDSKHDPSAAGSVTVTIKKANLTVTAQNKKITYGDAPSNSGVTYKGFVNGESASALSGNLGYDYGYSQYGSVGTYNIMPKGLSSSNYDITYAKGTLTVEKASVSFSRTPAGISELKSNGYPQSLVNGGEVNGGTIYYSLSKDSGYSSSIPTGTNAGNYTVWYYAKGDQNHNDSGKASINVSIASGSSSGSSSSSSSTGSTQKTTTTPSGSSTSASTSKTPTSSTAASTQSSSNSSTKTTGSTGKTSTSSSASSSKTSDKDKSATTTSKTDNKSTKQPFVDGKPETSGWEKIIESIVEVIEKLNTPNAEDRLEVDMNGDTEVPSDTIKQIKGKDITVDFAITDDIVWSVNGLDVTAKEAKDVDFNVKLGENSIPEEIIKEVAVDRYNQPMTLLFDGEFGFTAVLSLNLGRVNVGLYANLFYYNTKGEKMEFISSGRIDEDGFASIMINHASDYLIVLDEEPMGKTVLTTHVPERVKKTDSTNANNQLIERKKTTEADNASEKSSEKTTEKVAEKTEEKKEEKTEEKLVERKNQTVAGDSNTDATEGNADKKETEWDSISNKSRKNLLWIFIIAAVAIIIGILAFIGLKKQQK